MPLILNQSAKIANGMRLAVAGEGDRRFIDFWPADCYHIRRFKCGKEEVVPNQSVPVEVPADLSELAGFVEKVAEDSKKSNARYFYVATAIPTEGRVVISKYYHERGSDCYMFAEVRHDERGAICKIFPCAKDGLREELAVLGEAMESAGFRLVEVE